MFPQTLALFFPPRARIFMRFIVCAAAAKQRRNCSHFPLRQFLDTGKNVPDSEGF